MVVTPLPFPAVPQAQVRSGCVPGSVAAFPSPAASLCPTGLGFPVSVASSIYPTTWLHPSLHLAALSESCHLPPHSQPVCQLLCPFSIHFSPALTSLFTSHGPAPAWQPFHPSSFSLGTFYAVVCQGTVSTAVCLCCLTPSFHPCDPKPPENVLILPHSFLLFFSLLCFRVSVPAVSLIPAVTHSETQTKRDKPHHRKLRWGRGAGMRLRTCLQLRGCELGSAALLHELR